MNSIPAFNTHHPVESQSSSTGVDTLMSTIGQVVSLMMMSPIHKDLCVSEVQRLVAPPVRLGQFQIYQEGHVPVGYASWAFVDEDVSARLSGGDMDLSTNEWRGGTIPWLVDLIAPYGHSNSILEDIKRTVFPGARLKALLYSTQKEGVDVVEL